jgi:hypothetical protein
LTSSVDYTGLQESAKDRRVILVSFCIYIPPSYPVDGPPRIEATNCRFFKYFSSILFHSIRTANMLLRIYGLLSREAYFKCVYKV